MQLSTFVLSFISYIAEEDFKDTFHATIEERAALEKTRSLTGPHYPIVVELDFTVTPHITHLLLGEDFLARSRMSHLHDDYIKFQLRRVTELDQVLFYGIAPFAANGYPISLFYDL